LSELEGRSEEGMGRWAEPRKRAGQQSTIGKLLATACQRYHDRVALVRGNERRSYGELLDRGARLANALREAGLAPGTPVAAMLEDRIASLEVYVGAAFGGYPVIHINDRLAAPEVAHILADSGARVLFHTDGRSEVAAAAVAQAEEAALAELRLLVTIGRTARRARSGSMSWSPGAVPLWK
jgi:acyl-CoA synthetase (AMP-forming)/AMP-acid ligase II